MGQEPLDLPPESEVETHDIGLQDASRYTTNAPGITLDLPTRSEWTCHLFGASQGDGIAWNPLKGNEPNWFWRKMQFLAFGNRWVKDAKK